MKKILLLLCAGSVRIAALACPGCQLQQPRWSRSIVHGVGPEGDWEYLILMLSILIFLFTLFYSIKWLVRPDETTGHHIKYFILNDE